jgi:cysteine desulfurase / selenocysteine lyase
MSDWEPIDDAIYLDTAAHAVMPRVTAEAVARAVHANQFPHRLDDDVFFEVPDRLRASLARLIGARREEIALTTGASTGLQTIAQHLPWERGDEIVVAAGDFPMQHAVWKPMEARAGVVVKAVPQSALLEAITPRTRVVSVSHVRFDDGSLLDVAPLAEAAHARGALLVLDISQSCGSVPVDVAALGADAAVCAGYKWLLGPYGTGFAWLGEPLLQRLLPAPFYWTGQPATTFAAINMLDPEPSRDARRFDAAESATYFNLNLVAMDASVGFVLRTGVDAVSRHCRAWIDALFAGLPPHCAPASPRDAHARGAFGCFTASDTPALHARLRAAGCITSLRGGRIRVAPHLFNTTEHLERCLQLLSDFAH